MKWKDFLGAAYPEALAAEEASRSVVYRMNRWFGLRFGYAFYQMGVGANTLSVARLGIAGVGFYLVAFAASGGIFGPLIGVLLLAWQVNLDFADGAIARANGRSSLLGGQLDGIANAASRVVVVVILGFMTESAVLFLMSGFSAYVLIMFLPGVGLRIKPVGGWRWLAWVFRVVLFVPVMVVVLPMVIALHRVLEAPVQVTAIVMTGGYALLAVVWILLCLSTASGGNPPLESPVED